MTSNGQERNEPSPAKTAQQGSRTSFQVLLAVHILALLTASAGAGEKKLIEFGWDEPGTEFIRQHIGEMEKTPFDGCVFHVAHKTPAGEQINFTWNCWGRRAFTAAELQPAVDDLKATQFGRFRENFLRFNVTPGDVDWFEDFSAIVANAGQAARLASAGGARGILFDVEPYNSPVFAYRKQKNAAQKPFAEYQAQCLRHGAEVMQAFQDQFPGLTVFLTFGYSIAWVQSHNGAKPLADCQYGLLPAFLDGMMAGAKGKTRIVDGCELAYAFKEAARFDKEYALMKTGVLPLVADPAKYREVMSFGFGLWLDNNSHKSPWNTEDISKNYFSPVEFESSARKALETADQYVWIYTEQPRWWSDSGGRAQKLPAPYMEALVNARRPLPR